MFDVDIDFKVDFDPNTLFSQAVQASMIKKGLLSKHPCGQYFQHIAKDPITNLAAIPYEEAEVLGYFKIDFLHLSHLDPFNSKQEIRELINKEPNWDLLLDECNVQKLFHINKHFDLLQLIQPRSVQELADSLALIRPGKKHLLNEYLRDKERVRKQLYTKTDVYYFKRSHAIAYALTIVSQLHLISMGRL